MDFSMECACACAIPKLPLQQMNARTFAIIAAIAFALALIIPALVLSRCEVTNSDLPQTNSRGQHFGGKGQR